MSVLGLAFQRDFSVKFCRPFPRVLRLHNQRKQNSSLAEIFAIQHHEIFSASKLPRGALSSPLLLTYQFLYPIHGVYRQNQSAALPPAKRSHSHIPPTLPLRPVALRPPHLILRVKETSQPV